MVQIKAKNDAIMKEDLTPQVTKAKVKQIKREKSPSKIKKAEGLLSPTNDKLVFEKEAKKKESPASTNLLDFHKYS